MTELPTMIAGIDFSPFSFSEQYMSEGMPYTLAPQAARLVLSALADIIVTV